MTGIAHEPLTVARFMQPEAQAELGRLVAEAGDINPKTTPLMRLAQGKASLQVIREPEYIQAVSNPHSKLGSFDPEQNINILQQLIDQDPEASEDLEVKVLETRTWPLSKGTVIFYRVAAPELADQHKKLTKKIDRLNGVLIDWGAVNNWLVVGSFANTDMRKGRIVRAFREAQPETATLLGAKAMESVSLKTS